jgi:hypothetical protein
MKLLIAAALSAVLTVPCFASVKVSTASPNLPFPKNLGGKKALVGSPNLPFPKNLGGKKALVGSPNLPFPKNLGGKKA